MPHNCTDQIRDGECFLSGTLGRPLVQILEKKFAQLLKDLARTVRVALLTM